MHKILSYFIIIVIAFLLGACRHEEKSKVDAYIENTLEKYKHSSRFEENSEYAYIRIGNFLNPQAKTAIVISFDSVAYFSIYELKDGEWHRFSSEEDPDITRAHTIKTYIEDYNFDGQKDIGVLKSISNGAGIMTFHLWLWDRGFEKMPEFETVGNPILLPAIKTVRGFDACCAFTEITLTDYHWNNYELVKSYELNIANDYGIEAYVRNMKDNSRKEVKLSKDDVNAIIDRYSTRWELVDTVNTDNLSVYTK